MQIANTAERALLKIGHYLPLRRRYLLTRSNKLRLRYVVTPALGVLLLGMTTGASTLHAGSAYMMAKISPSSGMDDGSDFDGRYAAMHRRLERYARQEAEGVAAAGNNAKETEVASAPTGPREQMVKIGKGDTLGGVLQKAGVPDDEVHKAVVALTEFYDPRSIKPGQVLALHFDPAEDDADADYNFSRMSVRVDPLKTVSLEKNGDGDFRVSVHEKPAERHLYARRAAIETSLYGSALKAGIPAAVVADTIRIFSFDVDFQRDLRHGDIADVMYEQFESEDGQPIRTGNVVYAHLKINGVDNAVYRYETKDGRVDYYTANGNSIRKALLSTPVDGARISSGFGVRKHPVLGYTKMHKGIDFAAVPGTPIYASGDGVIEQIGRWGSYGNYIRIRHNSSIKSAYAHMQRFAGGLSTGTRVKQGEVIGFVGATGRVTGPHLHYEILMNGTQINPRSVKLPQGEMLRGQQLEAFKAYVRNINQRYAELSGSAKLADAGAFIRSRLQ